MARHIKQISQPLTTYLAAHRRFKLPVGEGGQLPPLLEVARRRGEAQLVEQFFAYMDSTGVEHKEQQLNLWTKMVADGRHLIDIVQRIGLAKYFTKPLAGSAEEAAYHAWCIFIDHLRENQQNRLLDIATKDFFRHHHLGLYPSQSSRPENSDELRKKATKLVRKHWGIDALLKESFETNDTVVHFCLRVKTPQYGWQILLSEQGQRLKTTRLSAYQQLISKMETEDYQCQPDPQKALPPVKSRRESLGWKY